LKARWNKSNELKTRRNLDVCQTPFLPVFDASVHRVRDPQKGLG
jgi:hypothetical protein